MTQVVVISPDELRAILIEVLLGITPLTGISKEQSDNVTLNTAVDLLEELGFPTSKAKIYKLTSAGLMPCRKYGNKLVFSRIELLNWVESQTTRVNGKEAGHGK